MDERGFLATIEANRENSMTTATMTSKGQVTIPVAVRAALRLETGSRVAFIELEKGQFAMVAATEPVQSLKGMLRRPLQPVSIADMKLAIAAQGAKAR